MKRFFWRLALAATLVYGAHSVSAHDEFVPSIGSEAHLSQSDRQSALLTGVDGAVEKAQWATGGRVLKAQAARHNGREGYRIKVLTRAGEVRVLFVDAHSNPR